MGRRVPSRALPKPVLGRTQNMRNPARVDLSACMAAAQWFSSPDLVSMVGPLSGLLLLLVLCTAQVRQQASQASHTGADTLTCISGGRLLRVQEGVLQPPPGQDPDAGHGYSRGSRMPGRSLVVPCSCKQMLSVVLSSSLHYNISDCLLCADQLHPVFFLPRGS